MTATIIHGNNLDILPTLDDCSIDSIVTDPPYELGFMGKKWDASGIAYNVTLWQECLRVLKPGGHLLAFGGTRTYHRMACAIEDAGFEIRDSIHWLYGSGFPKSLDVSKAIDKMAGAEREVVGETRRGAQQESTGRYGAWGDGITPTAPATEQARQWAGWGTALKPAHEPIVVARKPLVGTVAQNVLEYGTGAINIDASRIGYQDGEYDPTKIQRQQHSSGAIEGAFGASALIGKEIQTYKEGGRWPANVILGHTEDCQHVGTKDDVFGGGAKATSGFVNGYDHDGFVGQSVTVPVWECVPGCPVALLDEQSRISKSGKPRKDRGTGGIWADGNGVPCWPQYGDSGGASRFFYCAKPSRRERNAGLNHLPEQQGGGISGSADKTLKTGSGNERDARYQNHHPTVKPLALMRYLVRLITPPNGTVLDPFAGSGTTLIAAILEGFNPIGIEMTDEYLPIIEGRIAWAENEAANTPDQQELDL